MTILLSFLLPSFLLIIADAVGWIDLSTRPLPRVIKWVAVATVAWFLPLLTQKIFHLRIDERHLNFWKLFILGVLTTALLLALMKWIWKSYGPAPEGYRRCPHCRKPVLKVMLECSNCRKPINAQS